MLYARHSALLGNEMNEKDINPVTTQRNITHNCDNGKIAKTKGHMRLGNFNPRSHCVVELK